MNWGVDFTQPSTLRGLVWLTIFALGVVMTYLGKDVTQLLLLGAGVAGGLGVTIKDKP